MWSSGTAPVVVFGVSEPQNAATARLSWSVAALLLATGDALAARFGALAVRGELSGFSRAASGHCYFALKDAEGAPALLRCAMFRRAASLLDFAPADGQQVELRGRLTVCDARGELQMVVESLQRLGAGTLYEEFLRRRDRLQAQGLFDAARKRSLPAMPRAVGVVTSPSGAALHDVLTTLQRRAPHVRVVIYPSAVQGVDAPAALAAALQLAALRREVDTLLLVRGGGSLEDLWAFNDERVVQAVAASPLPVVCGVGHETDVTLCDLAADLRAATPTAAAELAAPAQAALVLALAQQAARLQRVPERWLQQQSQRLDALALRLGQPARALRGQDDRLQMMARRMQHALQSQLTLAATALPRGQQRLQRAMAMALTVQQQRLQARAGMLSAHDPMQVLKRGYAWVETVGDSGGRPGRPVLSAQALAPGQRVRAVWADGRAIATIDALETLPPLP
jgi:exodeoxyribonuclease VII large subunit